jgi:hypothetical protein
VPSKGFEIVSKSSRTVFKALLVHPVNSCHVLCTSPPQIARNLLGFIPVLYVSLLHLKMASAQKVNTSKSFSLCDQCPPGFSMLARYFEFLTELGENTLKPLYTSPKGYSMLETTGDGSGGISTLDSGCSPEGSSMTETIGDGFRHEIHDTFKEAFTAVLITLSLLSAISTFLCFAPGYPS